jgi:hypothetical protein
LSEKLSNVYKAITENEKYEDQFTFFWQIINYFQCLPDNNMTYNNVIKILRTIEVFLSHIFVVQLSLNNSNRIDEPSDLACNLLKLLEFGIPVRPNNQNIGLDRKRK